MNAETARLVFDLRSWWHAGSGLGRGGWCDSAVLRSPEGLPWIPGRTVRGLVREALTLAGSFDRVPSGAAEWFCGTAPGTVSRFATRPGGARFGNAEFPEAWRVWAGAPEARGRIEMLYGVVAATAIDENGLARNKTLRRVEMTAPVTLRATVSVAGAPDWDRDWRDVLRTALPLIRNLGAHRNRGYGRVVVTLEDGDVP